MKGLNRYPDSLKKKQQHGSVWVFQTYSTMDGCVYDVCSLFEELWLTRLKRDGPQPQIVGPTREEARKHTGLRRNTIKRKDKFGNQEKR